LALRFAGTQSTGWIDGNLPQQQQNKSMKNATIVFISIYLGRFDGKFLIDLFGAPLTLVGAMEIHRDARFVSSIESLNFRILHNMQKIATFVRSILPPKKEINATSVKKELAKSRENQKKKKRGIIMTDL
jgi:hypothetical protein